MWKYLFIGLLAINIIIILWMFVMVGSPSQNEYPARKAPGDETEFTIISTKEDLNRLMNDYIADMSKNDQIDYAVSLQDDVELKGSIMAFGNPVSLTMNFEPVVQKNGDLLLEQKSIKLGRLSLPSRKVLDYLRDNYKLPEWVVVNPKQENVYVALTEMKTKSNFRVKVQNFDLEDNRLAFKITVPTKTFDRFANKSYSSIKALQ